MHATDRTSRNARAGLSLQGLSVGDAFGECFFSISLNDYALAQYLATRQLPPGPWRYTDDTEMALAVVGVLEAHGAVDRDALADAFARRYAADEHRGYGAGARRILREIGDGVAWRDASTKAFEGMGSLGNGGAMRAGPIGAYFAHAGDDVIVEQARRSAEVTHAHPEGQAGAVAVALAAAFAWRHCGRQDASLAAEFFEYVLRFTPKGEVHQRIGWAAELPASYAIETVVSVVGNGTKISAPDTVPYALWCAAHHLHRFDDALWTAVAGLGDIDTNCAIVGSIVSLSDPAGVPAAWVERREALKW